ncbi:MAG: Nif3-like dinuclear metal center hexameric protein, partial [Candidatus Muirbacterium halophilum]|nr:Nif3-like dinuclear metal center hexameric protein [Candidatus Muirbacterium halophilum]
MKIKDLYNFLNNLAPFSLQEKWDNSGLIIGDFERNVQNILVSVELTSKVLDECIKKEFDTIITHHPAIFGSIKKINSKETPIIFKALQNNICIISMHTNFDIKFRDSFYPQCLENITLKKDILSVNESEKLYKIVVYVPEEYADKVRNAMFDSGAGQIGNYSCCSFNQQGI